MFEKFIQLLDDGKISWQKSGGGYNGKVFEFVIKIRYGSSGMDDSPSGDGWFMEIFSGTTKLLYRDLSNSEFSIIENRIGMDNSSKARFMSL